MRMGLMVGHPEGWVDYLLVLKSCSPAAHFLETGALDMPESWLSLKGSRISHPAEVSTEVEGHPEWIWMFSLPKTRD